MSLFMSDLERREALLAKAAVEILAYRRRSGQAQTDLRRAEESTRRALHQVGLGALLCGDTVGELVGRG